MLNKHLNFLFSISLFIAFGSSFAMEVSVAELPKLSLNQFDNELKDYICAFIIRDIIADSGDIFEARTRLSESDFIKTIMLINKNFRTLLPMLKSRFLQLVNEKFPNPFMHSIEESNQVLRKIFDLTQEKIIPENELQAAQAILAGGDVNLKVGTVPTNPILLEAIKKGYEKFAKFLIEHGANVNITNNQGYTALMLAVKNLPEIVFMLLKYGADPNKRDCSGATALLSAAFYNKPEMVQLLLDNNADPNIVDVDGNTALKLAERYKFRKIKKLIHNAPAFKKNKTRNRVKVCLIS